MTFTATGNTTVGAGLEYMFAPNWSAKVEYQYYSFGTPTFSSGPLLACGDMMGYGMNVTVGSGLGLANETSGTLKYRMRSGRADEPSLISNTVSPCGYYYVTAIKANQ